MEQLVLQIPPEFLIEPLVLGDPPELRRVGEFCLRLEKSLDCGSNLFSPSVQEE